MEKVPKPASPVQESIILKNNKILEVLSYEKTREREKGALGTEEYL